MKITFYGKFIKRILDILLSAIGMIILIPVYVLTVIAIKIDSPGPVLFRQKRFGKNKKYFYIYKFRSMRTDAPKDIPTHLIEDPNEWLTQAGKIIRVEKIWLSGF